MYILINKNIYTVKLDHVNINLSQNLVIYFWTKKICDGNNNVKEMFHELSSIDRDITLYRWKLAFEF
jgi:hypothetical protein